MIIASLQSDRDALQSKMTSIDEAISSLKAIAGLAVSPPAKIGGRGRPRSTKSQPLPKLQTTIQPVTEEYGAGLSKAEKKKQYNERYRARKAAKIKMDPNVKFSLMREFDLGDDDIKLINNYMLSWRSSGKLTFSEEKELEVFEGRSLVNLSDPERLKLRNIFYGCRSRVMDKTKQTAS